MRPGAKPRRQRLAQFFHRIILPNLGLEVSGEQKLQPCGELPAWQVREKRTGKIFRSDTEKVPEIRRRLPLKIWKERIQAFQEQRPPLRIQILSPEATDLGFLENV